MAKLTIHIYGATAEEIDSGIAAALAVFEAAAISVTDAAAATDHLDALHARGYIDDSGKYTIPHEEMHMENNKNVLPDLTGEQRTFVEVWADADLAAVEACCASWPLDAHPFSASLALAEADGDCNREAV